MHSLCKGQITFNNYYKASYNNFASTNIFPQPDSSNIIFSYAKDSLTGRQDLVSQKINKHGNLLVNKTYNIYNIDYLAYSNGLKQFIAATKTSFLASCVTYTSSMTTVIFTKINKTTLDTIKNCFYYDGIYNYYLNNFIKLNDNKYYLIGGKGNTTTEWPVIFHLDSNLTIVNIITLNNPIKEILWVFRRNVMENTNEYFNFTSLGASESGSYRDLMLNAVFQLDGQDRFETRDSKYFRLIQPYQRHTSNPNFLYIYAYSFALRPEEIQPSGTLNASRFEDIRLQIQTPTCTDIITGKLRGDMTFFGYAYGYNILRITQGYGGLLFAN